MNCRTRRWYAGLVVEVSSTLDVTGTKQQLRWLMPMEAFDQIGVKDKCDDYELGHSASACVH